jgi:hypothetical protein
MADSGYVCYSCQTSIPEDKFVKYDDKADEYFCDEGCFEDWAEYFIDDVIDFYKRMNISDVQV